MGLQREKLIKKFLKEESENIALYNNWIKNKDETSLKKLNHNFENYIFQAFFCSYIVKCLNYKALELKKRKTILYNKEVLSLNTFEQNFNEEKINLIIDLNADITEQIYNNKLYSENSSFLDLLTNEEIIKAIDELAPGQKQILCKYFFENKEESMISKELGISVQAVNKQKNRALKNIKSKIKII